uniref:KIB1-4 beta-propeller domain-containing protein n=1 Tax=Oryza glumipatula TaxID=40148 RepID=A0A0D9YR86_9ORYZ
MASSASSATSLASSITPCSPVFANQQQHPPCNLPWLLMPSTAATSLFCVVSEDTHRPGLLGDARCARFCGSFPGAWLAAELPESRGRGPVLLDLCTGECVALPRGCEAGESSSVDSASSPSTTSGRGPPARYACTSWCSPATSCSWSSGWSTATGSSRLTRRSSPSAPLSGRRIFLRRGCYFSVDLCNPCPLHIYFCDAAASFHGAWCGDLAPGDGLGSLRNNNPDTTFINHIQAVILSYTPCQAHPYYAAAIVSGKPNIMFWRAGMSDWVPPMLKWDSGFKMWQKQLSKDPIEDANYIFFGPLGGGFYVLNNKEDLLVYTPKANDRHGELTMSSVNKYQLRRNPRPTMPGPGEVLGRYLVESRGQLLMVVRFVSTEKATVAFDVFKLELKPPSWKKLTLDTLADRTIFLVRGCSCAVEMRKSSQCPPNIYFLDDSARFNGAGSSTSQAQQVEGPFPCGDTGRCCEQGIVRCLPREPPSDSSPWTWFYLPPYEALSRKWFMEQLIKQGEQLRLQEHQDGNVKLVLRNVGQQYIVELYNVVKEQNRNPYCAAAIVSGKPNIAFWRPCMNYWTLMLKWDAPKIPHPFVLI